MGRIGFLAALAAVLWAAWLPAFGQTPTPAPTPDSELDLIHFGDLIEIDVLGSVEFDWRGSLNPDGFIDGPNGLTEKVAGLCRREADVAQAVAAGLGRILREPKVVVRILDRSNRPNTMLYGAVRVPQRFRIKRPVNLNELIILAGGLTEKASGEIQIFRPASLSCAAPEPRPAEPAGDGTERERFIAARQDNGSQFINIRISELLSGKKEANRQILAGDVVTVLEARPIYVIGGVTTPRQIATRAQMTLSRAVAGAGGLAKDADPQQVTIFRRAGGETRIIEANLEAIRSGAAADPVLEAFDIVEVGQKGGRRREYPPILQIDEAGPPDNAKLPLTIVD